MYSYKIEHVQEVANGDEFRLIVDTGFHHSQTVRFWLDGVTTPRSGQFDRTGQDLGKAARDFTIQWFSQAERPWQLQVTKEDRRGGDPVYLASVFDAKGNSLGDALVQASLGTDTSAS